MALGPLFIIFMGATFFLFLDRIAVNNWGQKLLTISELIFIPVVYFIFSFSQRKIIIQPSENIQSFSMVYYVEKEKATPIENTFPFNRIIKLNQENQVIFFTKKMKEKYGLKILSDCNIYASGKRVTVSDKDYSIEVYSLCQDLSNAETTFEKVIEKIKNE